MSNGNIYKVDRFILAFAFRYALGRMSAAPSLVSDAIKFNLDKLEVDDIERYIKEIKECTDYGMKCDLDTWEELLAVLEKELERRDSNDH